MTVAVDTNLLVPCLTWDDESQAVAAAAVIDGADELFVSNVAWCELAWVLKRAHLYNGSEIASGIETMATADNVIIDRPAVESGLAMLRAGGDFADGILQYEAERARCDKLVTLDAAFARRCDPAKVVLLRP